MNTACAILAGGQSVRMGRDKATVKFRGKTLIKTVYENVKNEFDEIFIVSSIHDSFDDIDAPIVRDIVPIQTPMVGIATALIHSDRPRVFVVACDMPFVSREAIHSLINGNEDEDIAIPMVEGYYEPLHAVYSKSCLPHLLRLIGLDRLKISGVFPYVKMRVVSDEECLRDRHGNLVFSNINTIEELRSIDPDRTE